MTIREVAQLTGFSHQAIYKKIKARGLRLDALKDKQTGAFTEEGERIIRELFPMIQPVDNQVDSKVEKLTTEVEKLRNQLSTLEKQVEDLREERDFLRKALSETTEALTNAQKLQAATLAKVPLLTSGEKRRFWNRWRRKDE